MSKRNSRGFNFERLEDRRLLAADFGAEMLQCCCMMPAETYHVSTLEVDDGISEDVVDGPITGGTDAIEAVENESDVADVSSEPEVENAELTDDLTVEPGCDADPATESDEDVSEAIEISTGETEMIEAMENDSVVDATEPASEMEVTADVGENDPMYSELADPVMGTSGYFGEIESATNAKSLEFTPTESGTIEIAVASSFGDSETRLEITDADGDLIAGSMTEDLEGFQRLTFDVVENEAYHVTISSDESGEGYFMLTVDFEAPVQPIPVDVQGDEITEIVATNDVQSGVELTENEHEAIGECGVSQLFVSSDGVLASDPIAGENDLEPDPVVSVLDEENEVIVPETTNQETGVQFLANSLIEYQVLVDSANGLTTSFSVNGLFLANATPENLPFDDSQSLGIQPMSTDPSNLGSELDWEVELAGIDGESEVDEHALVDEVFEELGDGVLVEIGTNVIESDSEGACQLG